MKALLVLAGGGATGRKLIERTQGRFRFLVIDLNSVALEQFQGVEEVETLCGDATSTLVLRKARLEEAEWAVATTCDDEVNLEFCRLAREQFGVKRQAAVIVGPDAHARRPFEEKGIHVISRSDSLAGLLESHLDQGLKTTTDLGLGIGEICEVTVQSHSPVIGKTLGQLRPQSWILGAIFRKGQLVVPHGNTVIEKEDRCLLIGEPAILPAIAEYFRRGASEFPLQYGRNLCCLWDPSPEFLREAEYFVATTNAREIRLLVPPGVPAQEVQTYLEACPEAAQMHSVTGRWIEEYQDIQDSQDAACLMLRPPPKSLREKLGWPHRSLSQMLNATPEPVLLARGTQPYQKILVAVGPGVGGTRAMELAIDVARKLEAELTVVAARPAVIVSGEDYNHSVEAAVEQARGLAGLYQKKVEVKVLDGNPVRGVIEESAHHQLLVLAHRRWRRGNLAHPDVSWHILRNARCSTMVLPHIRGPQDGR